MNVKYRTNKEKQFENTKNKVRKLQVKVNSTICLVTMGLT